jgi:2-polyprenyl-6-hydroxyphenyl methylase / 3-demethylubiquinone-9 3-methyltransferase
MENLKVNEVNNEVYNELGDRWYTANDDPIALLRAESRARNPWIISEIRATFPNKSPNVLDLGCGGGFLSNELGRSGFDVTGLDASSQSLEIARRFDSTGRVKYLQGDAMELHYASNSFQVVTAMDFLEHVDHPELVIAEASRVLIKGGMFFFHTFNRNIFSWLFGIKGVELVVRNTPKNLHVHKNFIKPSELINFCENNSLLVKQMKGLTPVLLHRSFWHLLDFGEVEDSFRFRFTRSKLIGYLGYAIKQ